MPQTSTNATSTRRPPQAFALTNPNVCLRSRESTRGRTLHDTTPHRAALLGEYTEEVLAKIGYDEETVARLQSLGVV